MANPPPASSGGFQLEDEKKENNERWLLTYADMITLLVAFFIMMYSMSVVNLSKFKQVALSIKSGFGGPMDGMAAPSLLGAPGGGLSMICDKTGQNLAGSDMAAGQPQVAIDNTTGITKLKGEADKKTKEEVVSCQEIKRMIVGLGIRKGVVLNVFEDSGQLCVAMLGDKMFFSPGDATLSEDAKNALREVGNVLGRFSNEITVSGYAAHPPPAGSPFANSWHLSSARAVNAVDFFVEQMHIKPNRLSIAAYGERPIYTKDGKAERDDTVVVTVSDRAARE